MPQWGGNSSDEQKPNWTFLTVPGRGNTTPLSGNVFATGKGWVLRRPWGDEVLVAIGGLDTNFGIPNLVSLDVIAPASIANVASLTLAVRATFNEGVNVTGTPNVVLISSVANPANVTLTYSAADSDVTAGKVVFKKTGVSLAQANAVGITLKANSTSVLSGWAGITDIRTANAVANAIGSTLAATFTVFQEKPIHTLTQPVGTPTNTVNQIVKFVLGFNQALTLNSNAITIVAISSNQGTQANVVLTLNATASNTAQGNLVFQSANQNFSALTANVTFAVNATSVLTGFANIKGPGGNAVANAIAVANTQQVTAQ